MRRTRRGATVGIALTLSSAVALGHGSPLSPLPIASAAATRRRRLPLDLRGGGPLGRAPPTALSAKDRDGQAQQPLLRPVAIFLAACSRLQHFLQGDGGPGIDARATPPNRGTGTTSIFRAAAPPWLALAAISLSCAAVAAASLIRPAAARIAVRQRRNPNRPGITLAMVPAPAGAGAGAAASDRNGIVSTKVSSELTTAADAEERAAAVAAALAAADDAVVAQLAKAAPLEQKRRRRQRRREARTAGRRRFMERLRHLPPSMPVFPLAGSPDALLGRVWRQRISALLSGDGNGDKTVKPVRPEGARLARAARFWSGAGTIYWSYKRLQAKCAVQLPLIQDAAERERLREQWWDEAHDLNSARMLQLCLSLRGFYLKSGQFLGTRSDFMPKVYLQRLSSLHDAVPPMPAEQVRGEIERELKAPVADVFAQLNLTHPVGAASISQVHEGRLRATGERVAVKVQYPKAERVMTGDLRNVEALATFLQKFELDFDVLSSIKELSKQIHREFDFRLEASTMDRMHTAMALCEPAGGTIVLPHSRLCTKRVLIMTFVRGQSLAALRRSSTDDHRAQRKRIGKRLLSVLADAWGYMIFDEGLLHADPHPGNILIMPEGRARGPVTLVLGLLGLRAPRLRVGLLDWGQTKELDVDARRKFARLVMALAPEKRERETVAAAFLALGIVLEDPSDVDSADKLARVMFDTRKIPGLDFNPFSAGNVLKLNAVRQYPQDLYFVLRTVLMFRGMAQSLGVDFSLAQRWAPLAKELLEEFPDA